MNFVVVKRPLLWASSTVLDRIDSPTRPKEEFSVERVFSPCLVALWKKTVNKKSSDLICGLKRKENSRQKKLWIKNLMIWFVVWKEKKFL